MLPDTDSQLLSGNTPSSADRPLTQCPTWRLPFRPSPIGARCDRWHWDQPDSSRTQPSAILLSNRSRDAASCATAEVRPAPQIVECVAGTLPHLGCYAYRALPDVVILVTSHHLSILYMHITEYFIYVLFSPRLYYETQALSSRVSEGVEKGRPPDFRSLQTQIPYLPSLKNRATMPLLLQSVATIT